MNSSEKSNPEVNTSRLEKIREAWAKKVYSTLAHVTLNQAMKEVDENDAGNATETPLSENIQPELPQSGIIFPEEPSIDSSEPPAGDLS